MELREFVSEVLTEIFEGVADAQIKIAEKGGVINPDIFVGTSGEVYAPVGRRDKVGRKERCFAEFDVALTVGNKEQQGGKIGVVLSVINGSCGKSSATESTEVTRVKFTVPYRLP